MNKYCIVKNRVLNSWVKISFQYLFVCLRLNPRQNCLCLSKSRCLQLCVCTILKIHLFYCLYKCQAHFQITWCFVLFLGEILNWKGFLSKPYSFWDEFLILAAISRNVFHILRSHDHNTIVFHSLQVPPAGNRRFQLVKGIVHPSFRPINL